MAMNQDPGLGSAEPMLPTVAHTRREGRPYDERSPDAVQGGDDLMPGPARPVPAQGRAPDAATRCPTDLDADCPFRPVDWRWRLADLRLAVDLGRRRRRVDPWARRAMDFQ